jgi:hypothetical protein
MSAVANPRHERFASLVAGGMTASKAYSAAGFGGKGAAQSASRLLKSPSISARVVELSQMTTTHGAIQTRIDREWVLGSLKDIAENGASLTARLRALELLGQELGLFRNKSSELPWDGDLSSLTDEQLQRMSYYFERIAAKKPIDISPRPSGRSELGPG